MKPYWKRRSLALALAFAFGGMVRAYSLVHAADKPSVHGMLLFGDRTIYISHLPMFRSPHDYQAILAIKIDKASVYRADHQTSDAVLYTLVPERLSLPLMQQTGFKFTADLVRGHFERGGKTFASKVAVETDRVIHFRKFDPDATAPSELRYILFGSTSEAYVAHYITARPDFDQVMAVTAPAGVSDDDLARGVTVTIVDASPRKPLEANKAIRVHLHDKEQTLRIGAQIYLELGDLE